MLLLEQECTKLLLPRDRAEANVFLRASTDLLLAPQSQRAEERNNPGWMKVEGDVLDEVSYDEGERISRAECILCGGYPGTLHAHGKTT